MEKIRKIATAVRFGAEQLVRAGNFGQVYSSSYDRMGGLNLGGACGDCSKVILDMIRHHVGLGLVHWQAGMYYNPADKVCDEYSHNWLKLSNGMILDVTATQFTRRLPPVYIAKRNDKYKADYEGTCCEPIGRSPWRVSLRKLAERKYKELT